MSYRSLVRPARVVPLVQDGFTGMWTTQGLQAPPGRAHYALNLVLENPDAPGGYRQRAPFVPPETSATLGTQSAVGTFFKADGTPVTFSVLTGASPVISVFNWTSQSYSTAVSAANFTTASITVASVTRLAWCVFNNTVVFSDGTNVPWTWNGTSGAGGLTKLTNAPVALGRPTVYYAKLFFIKASAPNEIAWSEEDAANTGYEAGGYSNVWKLNQTGSAALTALHGTNEGLYYFRRRSMGVIRGAVTPTFTTDGTHDGVSESVGTADPWSVVGRDGEVWFLDQQSTPHVLPSGGRPLAVPWGDYLNPSSTDRAEPYGFDGFGRTHLGVGQGLVTQPDALTNRAQVWFVLPATTGHRILVLDADRRVAESWFVVEGGGVTTTTVGTVYDADRGSWHPVYCDGTTGRMLVYGYQGLVTGPDQDDAGNAQSTDYRLIGQKLGATQTADWEFQELAVEIGGYGTLTVYNRSITSRVRTTGTQTNQSVLLNTDPDDRRRLVFGLRQSGGWIMPAITFTGTGAHGVSVGGWTVQAVALRANPARP